MNNSDSNLIKLGHSEAIAVTMIFLGSKAFLGYPRMMAQMGATAGWIIILLSSIFSIAFWLIISSLLERFPGKSILEINEVVLGKYLGFGLNIIALLYIIFSSSLLLRLFSEAVILTALPHVPISALNFLFLIPMFVAAYLGLEAISRSAYISLPFIMAGTFAVLVFLYPFWDITELYPVLGAGAWPLLKYGFLNTSAFGEVLILAILAPFFSFGPERLRYAGITSIVIVAVSLILITVVYLMVIPMPGATENLVPFYQLSRTIYLGRYYQRLESVFILFWTFTAFLRLAIGYITAALITREIFKIPYYRPLLPALAVIILSLALTPEDVMKTVELEKQLRLFYGWIITFFLPSSVGAAAYLLKKGDRRGKKA